LTPHPEDQLVDIAFKVTSGPQARVGAVQITGDSGMSAEEFRRTFRGSPVRRAKREGLRRNAVIAMGNSGDRKFLPLLDRLAGDDDEVVAESAAWAVRKLT